MSFSGRTALITGAASGIGAAAAQWLDGQGIGELVLVDIDAAGLEALSLQCQTRHYIGDVADPALWERIEAELPRLDHALINAGVANGMALTDTSFEEWRRILTINLDGAFLGLRAALRVMKRSSAGPKSAVLTSSAVGVKPVPGTAAYGSSKAAVVHLARIAAMEHINDRIRINAIAPGRVETPIWTKTDSFRRAKEAADAAGTEVPAPDDFITADVLARQIGWLLSDEAENVTGTVLVSDGGFAL